ncbi:EF-hand domain-containing protein [Lacinutrix sp. 5H-3-7-4]|uniref:EF-hand domain-containing protein n=1 Tax=Lacinutrix sp. (strain 5H-3-7-4) TaxID=983544 RepID=UPI00020A337A|nr:EF-hand domain-containing protein [Lacinutrix sp. 5H-3-7-4]AEH01825.1 EF hand repeat-containing protein [Lacinutrix sp. 5H-3-7-4]
MKSNTIKTAILTFGIAVLVSNSSFGQSEKREQKTPPTFSELLKELDKDEDGLLSKTEVKGPLKEGFSEIDTDEDGFISEEEFKKAPKPKRRERR